MTLPDLQTTGPWIATFRDGPLADQDHDRVFAVGPIWEEIVLMQPRSSDLDYWVIVGGDGIPADLERVPWEGEVTYRLDEIETLIDAPAEVIAYYVQQ